ncbi:thiosulfate sulfurtransferase GlpE [Desulfovibrio sp. TomC]|uniref:thiosulfate sulfurtransferase GlpE n=1 Tax=Desulfovibrio sp. TomC TaxID=1562888 RepID=UPI0005BB14A2|nr:thiosulfate sulfurtransferase GlpE [Desulfovibrio sp. TomC]
MNKTITPMELRAEIQSGENIILLDLRKQVDFDAAPELIPGAVKLDPAQVETWDATIPTDKKIVIYCARGGAISQSVQQHFANKGVKVPYLEGGYAAWKASK